MTSLYSYVAISNNPIARAIRAVYRFLHNFSLPAPRWIFKPILTAFLLIREIYYFCFRVFICEPFFKASCTQHGRNVHTGPFVQWIRGGGRLIIGDNFIIHGKCSFTFAARYTDQPLLRIGNNVGIGHLSAFTIGREITIGNNVMIGGNVEVFDSPGHPTDPALRLVRSPAVPELEGSPALSEDVKAIHIEDNVWIGGGTTIFPGVTLGEGCIVSRGAVVMSNVLPYVIVAGNPARQIARLRNPKESV